MKLNKKGFQLLGEETVKIIIAVICIGFLVYLLGSLYYGYSGDQDLEQAEATLEKLVEEIDLVNVGSQNEFEIYNPDDWYFLTFSGNVPNQCSNLGWTDCVCMCEDFLRYRNHFIECNKNGACIEIQDFQYSKLEIEVDKPPVKIKIDKDSSGKVSFIKV